MKLLKILFFSVIFALMLSLIGCDIEAMLGGDISDGEDMDGVGIGGNDNADENGGTDGGDNIPGVDHTCEFKLDMRIEPSCTAEGKEIYECSCGKTSTKTLEKTAHTEEIIPAVDPTGSEPGKTEGKKCSVCGLVIVKPEYIFDSNYSVAENYDGSYAYAALEKLPKSEKLTTLYNLIDNIADEFHKTSTDASADDDYVVGNVNFAELGLAEDEAIAVWSAYRTDRPLYYWISNNVLYTSSELYIVCDSDYADADVRASLNAKIYSGVENFVEEAYSESKYNTALAFHDLIVLAIDYAYESDGRTPEDAAWAHNVIGVFDKGYGVCESYAKTFQLLLNYCDISNILVSGRAKDAHAWNLIQLDDGKWYWCDLTWDDTPDFAWGISYRYFCVTDNENVGWSDGPFNREESTFISSHVPNPKCDTGTAFSYDLPERSPSKFTSAEIMLRDTFNIGNLTYAIAGYNSVQLVAVNGDGDLNIPASVTYKGETFAVISIGKIENGRFTIGSIASYKNGAYTYQYTVGAVSIPDSVIFIWDDAFNMDFLTSITVSADNDIYASQDGVLFTKDLSVLIKYPTAKVGKSYTLPAETVKIAAGAFATLYSNTNDKLKLETIYLGNDVVVAGIRNYGCGYENPEYFEDDPWGKIRSVLSGAATIYERPMAA